MDVLCRSCLKGQDNMSNSQNQVSCGESSGDVPTVITHDHVELQPVGLSATDELDVCSIPFYDSLNGTDFDRTCCNLAYLLADGQANLMSLCCDENFNSYYGCNQWFVELNSKLTGDQQRQVRIQKESLAVRFLGEMIKRGSLPHELENSISILYEILSPSRSYNFPARCTLFAAAVYRLSLAKLKEEVYIMHYAAHLGYRSIIRLMRNWGLDVNIAATLTGDTPLLVSVKPKVLNKDVMGKMVEVLMQCGADKSVNTENKAGDTPLLMAILAGHVDVVDQLLTAGAEPFKRDHDGNTILHLAAQVNAPEICKLIMEKCPAYFVHCENSNGRTPIHIAAMHGPGCLEGILHYLEAERFANPDDDDDSPMDIAAMAGQKATFKMMWDEMDRLTPAEIEVERSNLEFFINRVEEDPSQWEMLADYLQACPNLMLHRLLLEDTKEESNHNSSMPTFRRLITASRKGITEGCRQYRHDAVRAVLDSSLFGDKVIITRTLDGVKPTNHFKPAFLCAGCGTTRPWQEGSNMEALLTTGLQIWDHQAVKLWINYKLKTAWICILLYFAVYCAFLGMALASLEMAIDLNITSDELNDYNHDHDNRRYCLEVATLTLWFALLTLDVMDAIRFGQHYWKWFGVYPRLAVNLCFIAVLVTHFVGSNTQWMWASLFTICAIFRAMEIFALFEWSSVYLVTLWIIVRRELFKFLLVALLFIFAFSVALRFALQAERDELTRLQTSSGSQSGSRICISDTGNDTNNTTNCVNTQSIQPFGNYLLGDLQGLQNLFYAGFRSLARAPGGLNYNGLEGYELFTAFVYLAFIGIVVLLLVSVFIAQANRSYSSVQDIAGQMANYSSARLLTQTGTMLPMLFFTTIKKPCHLEVSAYVWSDWPMSGAGGHKGSCYRCIQPLFQLCMSIWKVLQSTLVSESSSLIRRNKRMQRRHQIEALKTEIQTLKRDLKMTYVPPV